jgi:hypothetical protein
MTDGPPDLDAEQTEGLADLIGEAMLEVLRSEDPAALQAEIHRLLPEMTPRMHAAAATNEAGLRSLESCLARAIWNAAPLPSNGYRARPAPEPDRNAPCPCGSGTKYKRCCEPASHSFPAIPADAAWQAIAPRLSPKEAARLLDGPALPPEALAPLGHRVLEERKPRQVSKPLERHLAAASRLDSRYEDAVILAIELDRELLGADAALERALDRAAAADPDLRGAIFRSLIPSAVEIGEMDLARDMFANAREAQPDHPDLAFLEVSLALVTGDLERARERATFWLAWMRRRGLADEMADSIELLEMAARDPEGARDFLDHGPEGLLEPPQPLVDLAELAAEAAARAVDPQDVVVSANAVAFARRSKDVKKAEAAWAKAWPGHKPALTSLDAEFDGSPFDDAERWLTVLRREPASFDSLSILDDLVLLVEPFAEKAFPDLRESALEPLLRRSVAIVRASLAGQEDQAVEWTDLDNRPALRLLGQEARRLEQLGRVDEAASVYAWLLRLNSHDNHGHREWMINHHLRTGADERALELASAYPDDMLVATLFGRWLALWRLGRRPGAESELRAAAKDRPRVVHALLAAEMARPESDPYGIVVGGEEEAWLYREAMRETWLATPEALEFLRSLPPPVKKPPARRRGKKR